MGLLWGKVKVAEMWDHFFKCFHSETPNCAIVFPIWMYQNTDELSEWHCASSLVSSSANVLKNRCFPTIWMGWTLEWKIGNFWIWSLGSETLGFYFLTRNSSSVCKLVLHADFGSDKICHVKKILQCARIVYIRCK